MKSPAAVNMEIYRQQRAQQARDAAKFRELCVRCLQPDFTCYCAHVQRFNPNIDFVILIHPIEMKRRIATGRMSHLCLENSVLVLGEDYTLNPRVNRLLKDPNRECVMLYPGQKAIDLSEITPRDRGELFDPCKRLTVFVVDGTWATAKKMVRLSENIKTLPRICFTPETPSRFMVRRQPKPFCYSTIEAVHHTIELLGEGQGFEIKKRQHDNLLQVFSVMVQQQIAFIKKNGKQYRRPRAASPSVPA